MMRKFLSDILAADQRRFRTDTLTYVADTFPECCWCQAYTRSLPAACMGFIPGSQELRTVLCACVPATAAWIDNSSKLQTMRGPSICAATVLDASCVCWQLPSTSDSIGSNLTTWCAACTCSQSKAWLPLLSTQCCCWLCWAPPSQPHKLGPQVAQPSMAMSLGTGASTMEVSIAFAGKSPFLSIQGLNSP